MDNPFLVFLFIISILIILASYVIKIVAYYRARHPYEEKKRVSSVTVPYSNSKFDISNYPKRHRKIIENSDRIKALIKLNEQYQFKTVDPRIYHHYPCNSKREFDRYDIDSYFSDCIYDNYERYGRIIESINFNRTEYSTYISKTKELHSSITEEACQALKISLKKFQRRENKLFLKITHKEPIRDIDIHCKLTYRSPQGRNFYKDEEYFTFSQLESFYESITEEIEYEQTREYRIRQERAKMTDSLRYDILRRDNFRCKICGATANDNVKLHVDHIIPVSKGGQTVASNLRTLCERCNLGKSDKIE